MKNIDLKNPKLLVFIVVVITIITISFLILNSASTIVNASGRFNLPLSWILTPSGTSLDTDNNGVLDRERLPFEQGDITSDVDTNTWDLDYYNVANLTQGNVKLGVSFGRDNTGTLSPEGTAAAGDVCNSKTFYSGDSWTQKTGTRVPSDCGYIPSTWSGVCIYKTGDVSCPSQYPNKHTRQVCTGCTSCTGTCKGCNQCSDSCTGTCKGCNACTGSVSGGGAKFCDCKANCASCSGQGCTTGWTCLAIDSGCKAKAYNLGASCTSCTGSCKGCNACTAYCTGSCIGCNSCTGSLTSCTTYTYCCQ